MVTLDDSQGPIAEFNALRAEILQLIHQRSQILTLQLTLSGAVLGLTLTQQSMRAVALVVPVITYLLHMRYIADASDIVKIARYIREDLSDRVVGGLHWEAWQRRHGDRNPVLGLALLATFPGVSILGLVIAFNAAFLDQSNGRFAQVILIFLWLAGVMGTGAEAYAIIRNDRVLGSVTSLVRKGRFN